MEDILESKLEKLYLECIYELKSVDIDILNMENDIGKIDIKISKRNNKRYGCCKQENPDIKYKSILKRNGRKLIRYEKFYNHHIEISEWVLKLNDDIIKNTIMHEIIHCIPYCNNHGEKFKLYAKIINEKLGYDISRLGNREEDCEKSGIEIEKNKVKYKYKIVCNKCGQTFYRNRIKQDFTKRYRCGVCNSKFKVVELYD